MELGKTCIWVMEVESPLETTVEILSYLAERRVKVESISMNSEGDGSGLLQIHCVLTRDRIRQVERQIAKWTSVVRFEMLTSNKRL